MLFIYLYVICITQFVFICITQESNKSTFFCVIKSNCFLSVTSNHEFVLAKIKCEMENIRLYYL